MKKRKTNKVLPWLITAVSLFLAAAVLFLLCVTNFSSLTSDLSVDGENGTLAFEEGEIRILQLSDVQTSNLIECAMAYPTAEYVIRKAEPDLIVLTGDNISNGSGRAVLNTFISFMDSFEIPWALVFGNHDYNSAVDMDEICEALEKSEYCIFKRGDLQERNGNYYYNLERGGEALLSLIFMDSEKSGFTAEQVAWYENVITSVSEDEGRVVPSFVFFHIPIPETLAAHEQYAADNASGSGVQRDGVRVQKLDCGFFDTVKSLGSTQALFYGHDHLNSTFIDYGGVKFCYATKTGITVYFDRDSLGGNLITVYPDASFEVERVLCR